MVARSYTSPEEYRYGFNGQERETELDESTTSAEYWMYDGRLGRRWNVDPMIHSSVSPYVCFLNSPIKLNDPLGLSPTDPANGRYKHESGSYQNYKNGVAVDDNGKPIDANTNGQMVTEEMLTGMKWVKVIDAAVQQVGQINPNADDMSKTGHDDLDPSILSNYEHLRGLSSEELESQFSEALNDAAGSDGIIVANRFISGSGTALKWRTNSTLSQSVASSSDFIEFTRLVEQPMIEYYHKYYSLIGFDLRGARRNSDNLNFTFNGKYLSAMLGGTQAVVVEIMYINYEYHFKYTIIDVFGSDRDDVENAKSILPGLVQMYILQKERDQNKYRPFVNYVEIIR